MAGEPQASNRKASRISRLKIRCCAWNIDPARSAGHNLPMMFICGRPKHKPSSHHLARQSQSQAFGTTSSVLLKTRRVLGLGGYLHICLSRTNIHRCLRLEAGRGLARWRTSRERLWWRYTWQTTHPTLQWGSPNLHIFDMGRLLGSTVN